MALTESTTQYNIIKDNMKDTYPPPPVYKKRMNYYQWLIEDFQYWYYHDFGHPDEFKYIYIRVLEYEHDLKQKAKRLKRRWDGGIPEILEVPIYPEPHKMHANHNPEGW